MNSRISNTLYIRNELRKILSLIQEDKVIFTDINKKDILVDIIGCGLNCAERVTSINDDSRNNRKNCIHLCIRS